LNVSVVSIFKTKSLRLSFSEVPFAMYFWRP